MQLVTFMIRLISYASCHVWAFTIIMPFISAYAVVWIIMQHFKLPGINVSVSFLCLSGVTENSISILQPDYTLLPMCFIHTCSHQSNKGLIAALLLLMAEPPYPVFIYYPWSRVIIRKLSAVCNVYDVQKVQYLLLTMWEWPEHKAVQRHLFKAFECVLHQPGSRQVVSVAD